MPPPASVRNQVHFYNAIIKITNEWLYHPHEGLFVFFLITQWCLYPPDEGFHVTFIMQSPKFLMNVSTTLMRALPLMRVVEAPS